MKKMLLVAITTLSLVGPWGCGKLSSPMAPVTRNSTTSTPSVPSPIYVNAWSSAGAVPLINPQGIAIDANQNVYVTDLTLNEVFKFDSNGTLLAQWGNTGTTTLDQPTGIAVQNGNVYVADSANSRIVKYDASGTVQAILSPMNGDYYLFLYPTGVSFDAAGNLYVSDNSDEVYEFNSSLQLTAQFGASGISAGAFDYPVVSSEDTNGNMYVVNNNSDNVVKFNPQLNTLATWGATGDQAGQFYGPSDVKLDSNGNVYVVDSGNDRIQVFNAQGTFLTQWGQGGDASQNLNGPNSMAFDAAGNAYVVDTGNDRIVKYTFN